MPARDAVEPNLGRAIYTLTNSFSFCTAIFEQ